MTFRPPTRASFCATAAAFALALVAGCGAGEVEKTSDPSGVGAIPETATPAQSRAFAELQASTGEGWRWLQNPTLGTPAHLSTDRLGAAVLAKGEDPAVRSLAFLEANKELFRMRSASSELVLKRAIVDSLGMTHTRFQQTVEGVPVASREVFVHYDAAGRIVSIDADYVPGLDARAIDLVPALTEDEALSHAESELPATDRFEPGPGRLVVYAPDGAATAKLAYEVAIRANENGKLAIWQTTIDAKTGSVLHRYDNLQTVQGSGQDVLGQTKTFEVTAQGAGFVMTDQANGVQISTTTARTAQVEPGTLISSTTATSWDTVTVGAGAAVSAHVNAENVFNYYKGHHARNAIDGQGSPMLSTVHYGKAYDNAAWDGTGMLYGDGGLEFIPLSLALDVVGHEFTHGVTGASSNLDYQGQSGALNEAVSDIFGCFIEHTTQPDPVKNWTIAESIVKSGGPLRDLTKPESVADPQPGHMKEFVTTQQDNGGVHTNSGIINNAAWLMTVGGVNPVSQVAVKFGIGWDKSEQVWYRANTTYFKQTTDFGQAAQGVLQSGKDLSLTPNELAIIDCAFKAVGVSQGDCSPITDPSVTPQSTSPTGASGTAGTTGPGPGGAPAAGGGTATAETAAAPGTHKRAVTTTETTCSASAIGRGEVSPPSPWAALLGVLFALGARRRRGRA
jgi:MYXO-CTERM domain-containing protein